MIANDTNVYGVKVLTAPTHGVLTLNANGTFTYVPSGGWIPDSFVYQANGTGPTATVTLGAAPSRPAPASPLATSRTRRTVATSLSIKSPGVLSVDSDAAGYPLTVALSPANAPVPSAGLVLSVDQHGGFNASVAGPGTYTFTYKAQNSQGTLSATAATVTLIFPAASGLPRHGCGRQDKSNTDQRLSLDH